ncbi:MAG: serine acetyltransferase [Solirubrobacteraceae bacterium]
MSLREAIVADARVTSALRFEPHERSRLGTVAQVLRLMLVTDAFAAQVLYRLRVRLKGVPLLPHLLHRLSIQLGQVSIGAPVVMDPGVYLIHGQVVIDGIVRIGSGTQIGPFVTIGLRGQDLRGPTIGPSVFVGTGAKLIGPITIGEGARIGANAVVIDDVAAGATVVGAPARQVA